MNKYNRRCYVAKCKGGKKGSEPREYIGYFKIPGIIKNQDEKTYELSCERRRLWLKKLSLCSYKDVNKVKICSRHFLSGKPSKLFDKTHPDWLPSLDLGVKSPNSKEFEKSSNLLDGQRKLDRHERRINRSRVNYATPVSRKQKLLNSRLVSTPVPRVLQMEHPMSDLGVSSILVTPSTSFGEGMSSENQDLSIRLPKEVVPMPVSEEILSQSFWDEAGVSLIWKETGMIILEDSITETVGYCDEGIDSLTSPQNNSVSLNEDENIKTASVSTQTISSYLLRRDGDTQTEGKFGKNLEQEMVDSSTQCGIELVERCSQTLFRVCDRFELEYVELELQKSSKEIRKLNVELEKTNSLLNSCREQINKLVAEVAKLEDELSQHKYSEFYFGGERGNLKVKYFTGLESLEVLLVIVKHVSPFLLQNSKLTLFQQVILTIMKLRLALTNKDLAYRFWVSEATVGRIFNNCLNALYNRLYKFIKWPERDELWATMPMCFREKFGKQCAVIIDCFEVFTYKPSNVKSRAETYSNYKSCNTVKFLIGVTPQGSISFISKGWGGRVSDKHLTENSGLLEKLLPGDLVLADRGFNIDDSVGFYYATIKYPTFTKGKKQLSPQDVESTRKLANVRIHVERVIGHLRQKYTILFTKLPIELLQVAPEDEMAILDKIAVVCSALTNLTPSVVPFD